MAKPIAFIGLMIVLVLVGLAAPSWVETGRIEWRELRDGLGWMSGLLLSIAIGSYRARYAESRNVTGFAIALIFSVVFLALYQATDQTIFRWAFLTSVNLSCPFLVRKQAGEGPAEAGHYR